MSDILKAETKFSNPYLGGPEARIIIFKK